RESPTTNSKRIAMAYPGVQYEFLGVTDYSWITIMTPDGLYGYISPKLVGPLPGEENGRRVTVTKSMTIHEEPTYYSNEPSSVRSGHSYYVINDKLEEWVQIRNTDGSIGYVNRKYIR
ncbi:MAG: SH3 domain-containing protein, partial [Firmicutes bacterium]|nr:SH3 domain-containing protein [Bacillota bacterium]